MYIFVCIIYNFFISIVESDEHVEYAAEMARKSIGMIDNCT
jgi:hypothetical protein